MSDATSITYSKRVRWSRLDGSSSWEVSGTDLHDVQVAAWRGALMCGWTPKRWWKFWRWDDSANPTPEMLREAQAAAVELQRKIDAAKSAEAERTGDETQPRDGSEQQ